MSYIGDVALGQTVDFKFTSRAFATGAPTTLAGSPAISAYIGNNTTQLTAGITLSVDFDSVTGLNNVRVVASGGNGYAAQTDVELVITTGTVGGVSVVGEVVGTFSIENRSALRPVTAGRTLTVAAGGEADANVTKLLGTAWLTPGTAGTPDVNVKLWNGLTTVALPLVPTTAGRTLDVTATGEAGIDWANIGAPTTTQNLSGTTIAPTQKVDVDTIKTNPVVNGGTITFPTNATVASTTNITGGTITTVTNLTNAPTAGDFTATMKASIVTAAWDEAIAGHLSAGSTGLALNSASSAGDPWATALPGAYGAGTAGKIIGDNINATISSRMATYAQPTGFLAATFPAGTIANTTNITAGIITTATNLTNAPTAGDFTAAMKTSIGTAVAASAVASVTGNVGGNVVGNVGGSVGSVVGLTASNLDATISSRATPAQVNAEVLDVLNVDTFAQPGQGTPPATTSIRLMTGYLYKAWRNRTTQSATDYELYNDDAVTVDQKAAASDSGTLYDRGEVATGP